MKRRTGKDVTVDQRGAKAAGNVVGGDLIIYNNIAPIAPMPVVDELLSKLQEEIDKNEQSRAMIDALLYYYDHKGHDEVAGLEAKLIAGGREDETPIALEKKEQFVKLLDKWSMYQSAQEIFVHLLARAEHEFTYQVLPLLGSAPIPLVNDAITARIVDPIVGQCGASVFKINHGVAMGMFYWLAEQCFVRWHK